MATNGAPLLPKSAPDQIYVKISALHGCFVTLPERLFVSPADPKRADTVPSMCFLVEHRDKNGQNLERVVFDLGLKRDLDGYVEGMRAHIKTRQPILTEQDTKASLAKGGLDAAKDIDTVMLSHVHWDHIGTPTDFSRSRFVVGSGTMYILEHGAPYYPKPMMEIDPLPYDRTVELPPTPNEKRPEIAWSRQTDHKWQSLSSLANVVDYFGDGSMYLVDSPGHLQGHMNLLCRVKPGKWVYLGGDCCHDARILNGEREIAMYDDGKGGLRSVHSDTAGAKQTIANIRNFLTLNGEAVEYIVAHDLQWSTANSHRFFPNWMY